MMLALLVAALVPTVVMSAALALERLEGRVFRPVSLDPAHVAAAVTPAVGDGNVAAPGGPVGFQNWAHSADQA